MFVGLDVGTTAVKAILTDAGQRVLATATIEHPTLRPRPGWAEQEPDGWLDATRAVFSALRSEAPAAWAAVTAIGLSGQMHSAVLLGADEKPLQPAMLWNDARGEAERELLGRLLPEIATVTGVQPMAGFTAAKLLWQRQHRPDLFGRIARIVLPKDYVRLWLTGEIASDVSDAAGTQLLDQAARVWWPEAIDAVGLNAAVMPELHEGIAVTGKVRPAIADELGLTGHVVVAAGGGDSATGALGIGCIAPGQGFISLGTGAVFAVAADRYAPKPETMLHTFAHCVPGRWYQMAGMLNGAGALRWWLSVLQTGDIEAALGDVARQYRGPADVTFLPYLAGERTPHNNAHARATFVGVSNGTTRADLTQAVLEGVAFSLRTARDCLIAADSDCPEPAFIGGGARARIWGEIITNVTGLRLTRYRGADTGPAMGAARLAMIAAGAGTIASVGLAPEVADVIEPDGDLAAAYAERFEVYRALYPATLPATGRSGSDNGA